MTHPRALSTHPSTARARTCSLCYQRLNVQLINISLSVHSWPLNNCLQYPAAPTAFLLLARSICPLTHATEAAGQGSHCPIICAAEILINIKFTILFLFILSRIRESRQEAYGQNNKSRADWVKCLPQESLNLLAFLRLYVPVKCHLSPFLILFTAREAVSTLLPDSDVPVTTGIQPFVAGGEGLPSREKEHHWNSTWMTAKWLQLQKAFP